MWTTPHTHYLPLPELWFYSCDFVYHRNFYGCFHLFSKFITRIGVQSRIVVNNFPLSGKTALFQRVVKTRVQWSYSDRETSG